MKHEHTNGGPNAHAGKLASEKECRNKPGKDFNCTSDVASGGTSKRFLTTEEPIKTFERAKVPGGKS